MPLLETFSLLVGAIVSAFIALALWEVGSRGPEQLARDVAAALRDAGSMIRGIARLIGGLFFATFAVALIALAITPMRELFSIYAIGVFLCGLVLEALIGEPLRRVIGIRTGRLAQK